MIKRRLAGDSFPSMIRSTILLRRNPSMTREEFAA